MYTLFNPKKKKTKQNKTKITKRIETHKIENQTSKSTIQVVAFKSSPYLKSSERERERVFEIETKNVFEIERESRLRTLIAQIQISKLELFDNQQQIANLEQKMERSRKSQINFAHNEFKREREREKEREREREKLQL
ncbi:hypothetical protein HYC85_028731 [Camellia sinensis]|uniref:Uncharacterized protein n=1 Tax=Camellia sinensis TaxID=4442 RepID=A0A7J7FVX8_CAMSI|nr:hypothetical protein HYC85_028731 [Camellia sinensis]